MDCFSNSIEKKISNFIEFINSIIDDEHKIKFDEYKKKLKDNYWQMFLFIIYINEKNKDKYVNEFMQQFNIGIEHKQKINAYYDYFIWIKNLIN